MPTAVLSFIGTRFDGRGSTEHLRFFCQLSSNPKTPYFQPAVFLRVRQFIDGFRSSQQLYFSKLGGHDMKRCLFTVLTVIAVCAGQANAGTIATLNGPSSFNH